jgi:signal peptidase I
VPGDTIQARGQEVLINGRALEEPYIKPWRGAPPEWCQYAYGCEPLEVPAARYFVMGDNRDNSQDSRYYGFVSHDAVVGRIFTIYFSWDSEAHRFRLSRVGKSI